jgi:hypothetical protein
MAASQTKSPALWTRRDWNAFFGFGTNILVNMLVLTGLLRFVLKMPDSLVFGRILPALGLMMCLSTMYYAWLAYRLASKSGRDDVCALPSGVSGRTALHRHADRRAGVPDHASQARACNRACAHSPSRRVVQDSD